MKINKKNIRNVILVGPMGVGKTTIGRILARELGLRFFDSDYEIEKRAGADIAWIFDVEGESGFREREVRVIAELTGMEGIVLSTGGGTVLRAENRQRITASGFVIFLNTSLELQVERTRNDHKRPILKGKNPETVLKEMKKLRNPLYASVSNMTVFVGESGSKQVVSGIIEGLNGQGYLVQD